MDKSPTAKPSRSTAGRRTAKKAPAEAEAREERDDDAEEASATEKPAKEKPARAAAKKAKSNDDSDDEEREESVEAKPTKKARAEADEAARDEDERDEEDDEDEDDAEDADDGEEEDDEEVDEKPRTKIVAARRSKSAIVKESEAKRGRGRDLLGVVVCVVVVLFARASLADHYVVPTGSMEPTVAVDDRVVVAKSAYGLRVPLTDFWLVRWGGGPQRGDVVVLESPEGGTILLKRIVGLPGDTITVHGGEISVNGTPVPVKDGVEDLLGKQHLIRLGDGGREFPNPDVPSPKLPANKYLVMGDNRGNSKDGRYFGLVDEDVILGHAVRIYWSGDSGKSFFEHFSWKPL